MIHVTGEVVRGRHTVIHIALLGEVNMLQVPHVKNLPLLGSLRSHGERQLHSSAQQATSPTLPFLGNADPQVQLQQEWGGQVMREGICP